MICKMSTEDAEAICKWRYAPPYDVYNYPDYETVSAQGWAISSEEKREAQFRVLKTGGRLAGYFRLVENEHAVMLGLGLSPELCGNGLGKSFMEAVTDYYRAQNFSKPLRLEVREFNERAIKCYEKAGFAEIDRYYRDSPIGGANFILMEYKSGAQK